MLNMTTMQAVPKSADDALKAGDIVTAVQMAWEAQRARRYQEAADIYSRVIDQDIDQHDARRGLAESLYYLGRFEEAWKAISYALAAEPNHASGQNFAGMILHNLGREEEAGFRYKRAAQLAPTMHDVQWNLALWKLARCNNDEDPWTWREAWAGYEWRKTINGRLRTVIPEWSIDDAKKCQHLVVWAEQGLGDTIMFSRFLKQLREIAPDTMITLEVQPPLTSLMHDFPYVNEVTCQQPYSDFPGSPDRQIALASLVHALRIVGPRTVSGAAYLKADPLPMVREQKARVGFCWKGSPSHANDQHRSIPREAIAALWGIEGVEAYSLQLGDVPAPGEPIIPLTSPLLADTARLIASLDMVVSADTMIAHLAGALGKPVLNLLPFNPDFRWFNSGDRTIWYDSMVLIRQMRGEDWPAVIERVAAELPEYIQEVRRGRNQ